MQIITYLILFALYVAHKAVHANYGYQYKVKNERTNQIYTLRADHSSLLMQRSNT